MALLLPPDLQLRGKSTRFTVVFKAWFVKAIWFATATINSPVFIGSWQVAVLKDLKLSAIYLFIYLFRNSCISYNLSWNKNCQFHFLLVCLHLTDWIVNLASLACKHGDLYAAKMEIQIPQNSLKHKPQSKCQSIMSVLHLKCRCVLEACVLEW